MDSAESWRTLFQEWPKDRPRQGMILTTFLETIPFVNFMISEGILLVERDRPDSSNARKVMISFGAIAAVKSTDTLDFDQYKAMGFK